MSVAYVKPPVDFPQCPNCSRTMRRIGRMQYFCPECYIEATWAYSPKKAGWTYYRSPKDGGDLVPLDAQDPDLSWPLNLFQGGSESWETKTARGCKA